jgi:hypothetical protein
MSRVETAAKPIISALVAQQSRVLTVEEQSVLATWCAIKTAVNERAQLTDGLGVDEVVAIREADCGFIRQNMRPSENWRILIHNYNGLGRWRARFLHYCVPLFRNGGRIFTLRVRPNIQTTTMGFGHFIFHAFYSCGGINTFPTKPTADVHTIWPARDVPLQWPSHPPIDDSEADAVSLQFYHLLLQSGAELPPMPSVVL